MILVAFLGGSSVMAKGGHLKITFVVDRFSPERRRVKMSSRPTPYSTA